MLRGGGGGERWEVVLRQVYLALYFAIQTLWGDTALSDLFGVILTGIYFAVFFMVLLSCSPYHQVFCLCFPRIEVLILSDLIALSLTGTIVPVHAKNPLVFKVLVCAPPAPHQNPNRPFLTAVKSLQELHCIQNYVQIKDYVYKLLFTLCATCWFFHAHFMACFRCARRLSIAPLC